MDEGSKESAAPSRKGTDHALAAVRRLAREVDPEPSHAFQVCRLAQQLFDRTAKLHGLDKKARRLLTAAALLHDIGHTISVQGHHKHARDLILSYELTGFSERERSIIACVARYHRKAHPRPHHKVFRDLNETGQALVSRLSAVLRIADGLDRAHDAAVCGFRVRRGHDTVTIHALLRRPSSTDIWGGLRKRGLFEEVFKVAVEIIVEAEDRTIEVRQ